jgi:hypothetical protein
LHESEVLFFQQLKKPGVSNATATEDDILARIKNQAKLLQYIGSKPSSSENNDDEKQKMLSDAEVGPNPAKELKLSLVPGYEDDSEGEEEVTNPNSTPLFPIAQTDGFELKKSETNTCNTRIYEYRDADSIGPEKKSEDGEAKSEDNVEEQSEESKSEQEYKTNKFLENIDALSKAFQRKKRIAFDGEHWC